MIYIKPRESDYDKLEFFGNAIVGVFDYLGYKKKMENTHDIRELGSIILQLNDIIKGCGESKTKFKHEEAINIENPKVVQISDTFIVYVGNNETPQLIEFLWNVHHMLFYSMQYGYPLRGSVSTGELLVGRENEIIIGKTILEAFELEKRQKWFGASICNSLQELIETRNIISELYPLIIEYKVPMKSNNVERPKYAINHIADFANYIEPNFFKKNYLDNLKEDEKNEKIIIKIENTKKFLKFVGDRKRESGGFPSPLNRKVVLGNEVVERMRAVRFVIDEETDT